MQIFFNSFKLRTLQDKRYQFDVILVINVFGLQILSIFHGLRFPTNNIRYMLDHILKTAPSLSVTLQ